MFVTQTDVLRSQLQFSKTRNLALQIKIGKRLKYESKISDGQAIFTDLKEGGYILNYMFKFEYGSSTISVLFQL